jgi:hypothetical protein
MVRNLGRLLVLAGWAGTLSAQPVQHLDVTSFVVVGGGWSAGYAEFELVESHQRGAFPTLMARAMNTIRPQPLFRPQAGPPLLVVDPWPGVLPPAGQSILRSLPFPLFAFNLSIPWVRVQDSLLRRPSLPLIREGDYRQTLVNLVLGYPHLLLDAPPAWTQLEYVERMAPTLVLVQLGLGDVLEGAVLGDSNQITPSPAFAAAFSEIAERIRRTFAQVIVLTVPNPLDTAYFLELGRAAGMLGLTAAELKAEFGLRDLDRLTPAGLVQISDWLRGRGPAELTPDAWSPEVVVRSVDEAVTAYNAAIRTEAARHGYLLYDLNDLVRQVRESGVDAGSRRLGGGPGEGFYGLDGLFPTRTAHAVIANELLRLLNATYQQTFRLVEVDHVAAEDPSVAAEPRVGGEPPVSRPRAPGGIPVPLGPRQQRGQP